MIDLRNPAGVGERTVSRPYRVLARIFIGPERRWLELFDPSSELNRTKVKADKGDAFRIFAWFLLTFAFSFIAWWYR
jgi:hypothetical protein